MSNEERDAIFRLEKEIRKLRRRSTIALAIALLLLVSWCASPLWNTFFPTALQLHTSAVSQTYVRFWEGRDIIGVLVGHYGDLEFRFTAKNGSNGSVIKLDEEGLTMTLSKNEIPQAEWKLTANGPQFKKLTK